MRRIRKKQEQKKTIIIMKIWLKAEVSNKKLSNKNIKK